MPTVRDLRDHIRSLKSTQQITRATGQVAASRIRRAKLLLGQSRPYAEAFTVMLHGLLATTTSVDHPFTKPGRAGAPLGAILITADRGLAGALNGNLVRQAAKLAGEHPNVRWYSVGIKGHNALRRMSDATVSFWPLTATSMSDTARDLCEKTTADFSAGSISGITLISPKLVNVLSQPPALQTLVPLDVPERKSAPPTGRAYVEFSPSPQAVLARLFPKYLEMTIYSALLETNACYFAAQLIAMNNATENAGKLVDELTFSMNKLRQEAITNELIEIVSGAEASKRR